jgi:hypothetical protein
MGHKDIAYVPPRTNPCPTCGLQHRLVDDEFVHALERLGATPEQIAMFQEESDDLADAYGVEGAHAPSAETKREQTKERVRRHREKKRKERGEG